MVPIAPVARALVLCDSVDPSHDGNVDIRGVFDAVRPRGGYPSRHERFCVYVQLAGGHGRVPFRIVVRDAATGVELRTTAERHLIFHDPLIVVRAAMAIERCVFPRAGLYLVELHCNNEVIADTTLRLL